MWPAHTSRRARQGGGREGACRSPSCPAPAGPARPHQWWHCSPGGRRRWTSRWKMASDRNLGDSSHPWRAAATTSETEQFGYLLRGTSMTSSNLFNHATFVQEVFFNHARKLPNSFQMCLWWVSIAPPARP